MDPFDLQMFVEDTRRVVPNFEIGYKTDSFVQKLLGWFLSWISPDYMTRYTTTVYPKMYFPSEAFYKEDLYKSFTILSHERIHLLDNQRNPLWFRVSYLLPQLLCVPFVVLGLVSLLFSWWVSCALFGVGLLCLLPWPSPWRVSLERRGYAVNLAVSYWTTGKIPPELKERIFNHFVSKDYYWMSWSSDSTREWLGSTVFAIQDGSFSREPTYAPIHIFLKTQGLLLK
jgi:hypothetical protein